MKDIYGVDTDAPQKILDLQPRKTTILTNNQVKYEQTETTTTLTNANINMIGNVGIGTTNPGAKLHVYGERITISNSNRNYSLRNDDSWFRIGEGVDKYFGSGIVRTDGDFQVGQIGERFRVNTAGNVGIGTTDPSEKLEVNGNAKIAEDLTVGGSIGLTGDLNIGDSGVLHLNSDGTSGEKFMEGRCALSS